MSEDGDKLEYLQLLFRIIWGTETCSRCGLSHHGCCPVCRLVEESKLAEEVAWLRRRPAVIAGIRQRGAAHDEELLERIVETKAIHGELWYLREPFLAAVERDFQREAEEQRRLEWRERWRTR